MPVPSCRPSGPRRPSIRPGRALGDFRRAALAGAALLACLQGALAQTAEGTPASASAPVAASARHGYNLPAGALGATLLTIAQQSGRVISVSPDVVRGLTAPAVSGQLTAEEAVTMALGGHALVLARTPAGALTVQRQAQPARAPSVAAAPERSAETLSAVTVTATRDAKDEVFEKLGSAVEVTRAQLDRIPVTSARDMFTSEAGVYVMDGNQDPGLNINIRGIQGSGRNNVMIDGTRQNSSNYAGYAGQTSRVYVDPELIGGISIDKGPSSGVYGAGVIGGIVNMRTLGADDLIAKGESRGGRLRIIAGDKGYNESASLAGAVRLDSGLELTGGLSRRKSDNYHAGKDGVPPGGYPHCMDFTVPIPGCTDELPLTYQDMTSALLKAKYRFGDGHSLELGTTYYTNQYSSWQTAVALSNKSNNPQEATTSTYTARYAWKPSDNPLIDLHANLWKVNGLTENTNYFERYKLETWGMELYNTSRLHSPWVDVALNYGGEYHADDARSETLTGGTSGLGVTKPDPLRIGLTGAGKRHLASVFANASFMHGDWLQFDAGLRRDSYGLEARGSYVSQYVGQDDLRFNLDRSAHRVNPKLSLGITPVEGVQGFATYSEGFRPPSLAEAAGSGTVFQVPNVPNFSLKSEIAKNREVGVNIVRDNFGGSDSKLRVKLAVFESRYSNFITRSSIPYTATGEAYTYVNLDKVTYQGTELQVNFDNGASFVDFNYTAYDKMDFCNAGVCSSDIANIANNSQPYLPPRSSVNASAGVRLLDRKLTLGMRVRQDSKRGVSEPNRFNSGVQWVPYAVYDLFGSYAVSKQLMLGFSIENLRDKYYIGALSFSGVPSSGRNFKASMTYAF